MSRLLDKMILAIKVHGLMIDPQTGRIKFC